MRIDEIYQYTLRHWGEKQAECYIDGLFKHFKKIALGTVLMMPVPAQFGIKGVVSKYNKHYVYSKILSTGDVGIVAVLHEKMHQIECFRDDFYLGN